MYWYRMKDARPFRSACLQPPAIHPILHPILHPIQLNSQHSSHKLGNGEIPPFDCIPKIESALDIQSLREFTPKVKAHSFFPSHSALSFSAAPPNPQTVKLSICWTSLEFHLSLTHERVPVCPVPVAKNARGKSHNPPEWAAGDKSIRCEKAEISRLTMETRAPLSTHMQGWDIPDRKEFQMKKKIINLSSTQSP